METIKTKAYGEIQVEEETIINFKREILGFEGFHQYYLIEMSDLPNFFWLQSKDDADLAFIVINPRMFMKEYELKIDNVDKELLELSDSDEVMDFAIVNIPEDVNKMTMNLLGPIIINVNKRVAIQGISLRDDYGTKVAVFSENPSGEK